MIAICLPYVMQKCSVCLGAVLASDTHQSVSQSVSEPEAVASMEVQLHKGKRQLTTSRQKLCFQSRRLHCTLAFSHTYTHIHQFFFYPLILPPLSSLLFERSNEQASKQARIRFLSTVEVTAAAAVAVAVAVAVAH